LRRRALDGDVPRHRHHFQIKRGDGLPFLIGDEGVAAKPISRPSAASGENRQQQA
jgi:hypothetical protein